MDINVTPFTFGLANDPNAKLLDLATYSVKRRRRRQNRRPLSLRQSAQRQQREDDSTPFHKSPSVPSFSNSCNEGSKFVATTTEPANMASSMVARSEPAAVIAASSSQPSSEDMELLRSARQSAASDKSTFTQQKNDLAAKLAGASSVASVQQRRKRSKALGHALRKSRDLRHARDIAELLQRPLPPTPKLASPPTCSAAAFKKTESAITWQDSPVVPAMTTPQMAQASAFRVRDVNSVNRDTANEEDEDDWATFISSGYNAFPLPPVTALKQRSASSRRRGRFSGARSRNPGSKTSSPRTTYTASPSSVNLPSFHGAKSQQTGCDWLDDELAWVSSDEEREELDMASTPLEAPVSEFADMGVGEGLRNALQTPSSSSVDTLVGHEPRPRLDRIGDAQQLKQTKNAQQQWRASYMSDVFVTPQSSPQVDLGSAHVKARSHMSTFTGLADAVSRYAAELAGYDDAPMEKTLSAHELIEHGATMTPLERLRHSAAIHMSRHDSVSSAASTVASRDFSTTESMSTRPSSMAGTSDGGSSYALSPSRKPFPLPPSRTASIDDARRRSGHRFSTHSSELHSSSSGKQGKHARKVSDALSACSSQRSSSHKPHKRGSSSRMAWPQENPDLPPETPLRTASLQHQQDFAMAQAADPARPLMGAWLSTATNDTLAPEIVLRPVAGRRQSSRLSVESSTTSISPKTPMQHKFSSDCQIVNTTTSSSSTRRNSNASVLSTGSMQPPVFVPHSRLNGMASVQEQQEQQESQALYAVPASASPISAPRSSNGLRALFSRQRRESSNATPVGGESNNSSAVTINASPKEHKDVSRSRSVVNLRDRILSKMGGVTVSGVALDFASRPLPDVPLTPGCSDDGPPGSPSQEIFGSAALFSDDVPMTTADGLLAISSTSSFNNRRSRRGSVAGVTGSTGGFDMVPSTRGARQSVQRAGSNGPAGSLSRAMSLRSRSRGLVFEYDPSSPFYLYDENGQQLESNEAVSSTPDLTSFGAGDSESINGNSEPRKTRMSSLSRASAAAARRAALLGFPNLAQANVAEKGNGRAGRPPPSAFQAFSGRFSSMGEAPNDDQATLKASEAAAAMEQLQEQGHSQFATLRRKNSFTIWR